MSKAKIPPADVEREKRVGRIVGALGVLSLLLTLIAGPLSAINAPPDPGDDNDLRLLTNVGLNGDGQVLGISVRTASLLVMIPLVIHLYQLVKARNPEHLWWVPAVGLAACAVLTVSLPLGYVEIHGTAQDFVNAGPRTAKRAQQLVDDANTVPADVTKIVGLLLLGIWTSLASAEAQRVGLLTRFLGMFGLGAGITTAIGLPIGAQGLFVGWLGSVAILMLGYWPGGRPPAWDEGRAISADEVDARDAGHMGRSAR